VALVVRSPDAIVTAAQVTAHLAQSFAKWQLPDEILFVESLPLTSTGKLDKKVIRADLHDRGYRLPDLRGGL
jgi:fatty-acyl-CoA synthase